MKRAETFAHDICQFFGAYTVGFLFSTCGSRFRFVQSQLYATCVYFRWSASLIMISFSLSRFVEYCVLCVDVICLGCTEGYLSPLQDDQ